MTINESGGRIVRTLALGTCLALAGAGFSVATSAEGAPMQARAAHLEAKLKPSGDSNGFGEVHLTLNKARHRVCANVEWHRIAKPNAAHIHRRSDGLIVVPLSGSVTGGSHCKSGVSGALIGKILAHPKRYYFNVHNKPFPAGAIQGTLHH